MKIILIAIAALMLNSTAGYAADVLKGQVASSKPAQGTDFSKMAIEDAVMLMFMLIADDSQKDTKDMLADMNATTHGKAPRKGGL
jgi:hypothetical protein